MPEIPVEAQIFDLAFHPTESIVYTALLTGNIKAFRYDQNESASTSASGSSDEDEEDEDVVRWQKEVFSIRPSKKSCRGLALSEDGQNLYAVGKGRALHTIETTAGKIVDSRIAAHEAAINRIKYISSALIATGDDDGVVKLWDPRKPESIRAYNHHFDFISDFLYIKNENRLVATSGDGTLSVIDLRSSKSAPFAHSEDQEDELLSIASIRSGTKYVVGTQLGILSVFNKSSGWGDCVDRVPGHPHSIDALCNLPSSYPSAHSTILTGSSDGLLRVVQLFPTKLLGVVADHGDYPIERIAIEKGGEGIWVGSVGHDEALHMTNLKDVFEDEESGDESKDGNGSESDDENSDNDDGGNGSDESDEKQNVAQKKPEEQKAPKISLSQNVEEVSDSDDSDADAAEKDKKRKRKVDDPLSAESKKKKSKGEFSKDADPSFFSGL